MQIMIPEEEYKKLKRAQRFLEALEYWGVDNWCSYNDVKERFLKEEKEADNER